MYCVKCGRKARPGEKRCPACSTRLVTAKQLNELIKLKKSIKRKKRQKNRDAFLRFKQGFKQGILSFWDRLCAVSLILWQTVKNIAAGIYKAIKTSLKNWREKPKKINTKQSAKTTSKTHTNGKTKRPQIKAYNQAKTKAATSGKTHSVARANIGKLGRNVAASRQARFTKRTSSTSRPAYVRTAKAPQRSKPKKLVDSMFSLKHIRTTVAVILLAFTVLTIVMWGTLTDSGQRSFAKLGAGSWKGYILLGDEYMAESNYMRAVESYYSSIRKKLSLEGTYKLAAAYSYTGDISREVNALLACVKNYPDYKMAYVQLYKIFPYEETRPAEVNRVIGVGLERFENLE